MILRDYGATETAEVTTAAAHAADLIAHVLIRSERDVKRTQQSQHGVSRFVGDVVHGGCILEAGGGKLDLHSPRVADVWKRRIYRRGYAVD